MNNNLKVIREKANLTQEELARISGVSRGTISSIEREIDMDIKSSTLIALSKALGKQVSDIFFN